MKIVKKKLHYPPFVEEGQVYLFTSNRTLKRDNTLVMGRGAALCAKRAYPGIDKTLGQLLRVLPDAAIHTTSVDLGHVGAMQTKEHWRDDSPLALVLKSIRELGRISRRNPQNTYHVNYPAIGLGGLPPELIRPTLDTLPDNVRIYLI